MIMLSILIPARQEIYLQETVTELLSKASGEIEVIVVLDGYWPPIPLKDNRRLTVVHRRKMGMRDSINNAAAIARGKYIMKIDAHCLVSEGYDVTLQADCDDNWVVIPRRYSLDDETWSVRTFRPIVDYEYLGNPFNRKLMADGREGLHAWVWDERVLKRCNILLDENMTFQGSCWFTTRKYFTDVIGGFDSRGYGTFIGEAQELGLKCWLGGGKVMTNKKAWYAHLWKGVPYRTKYKQLYGVGYTRMSNTDYKNGNAFTIDYWMNNRWEGRKHDLSWLIERFWPVPSWPEDRNKWIPKPS